MEVGSVVLLRGVGQEEELAVSVRPPPCFFSVSGELELEVLPLLFFFWEAL